MFEPLTVTTTFHFVELVIIDTILIIVIVILFFLTDLARMRMMMLNWEQHQLAPSQPINMRAATLFHHHHHHHIRTVAANDDDDDKYAHSHSFSS